MRRSGALTLGVVLTLGAVTGGRGQELSGSVSSGNGSLFDGFVLPSMPENWADLPLKLTVNQTTSYNSNINAIPLGFTAPVGQAKADFTSTTNFGFSTKANIYGQQLYLDTTFGVIRYLHEVDFDSTVYSLNAGVDWTLTSRCAGTLGVSLSRSPAQITELVGTGVNYVTSTALNETGKCAVGNGFSLLFNSGLTTTKNTNPIDAVNDGRTALLSTGIEYQQGYSSLRALASISDTRYSGRGAAAVGLGLATETDFHSFTLSYTRQISADLSVTGLIGLVGTTNGFTLGLPKTLVPIYTLSANWALTPKLSLNGSVSRTVAPPTTIIANAETNYSAAVNLGYQMTPKVSITAGGSISYSNSAFTAGLAGADFTPFLTGAQKTYLLNAGLSYMMTPFLSAALTASYTERVGNGLITPQDLVTLSLNYKPY